jgi:signal peptidase
VQFLSFLRSKRARSILNNPKSKHTQSRLPRSNWVRAITFVALVGIIIVVFWAGLHFAFGTSTPAFVVSSGSMVPTLNVGDVIIVRDGGSFLMVEKGDIIVFHSPYDWNKTIVHRVYNILLNGQEKALVTKGDNNPSPDGWVVRKENYIGKVIFSIPQIGRIASIISPPLNYFLIIFFLFLIFVTELFGTKKEADIKKRE